MGQCYIGRITIRTSSGMDNLERWSCLKAVERWFLCTTCIGHINSTSISGIDESWYTALSFVPVVIARDLFIGFIFSVVNCSTFGWLLWWHGFHLASLPTVLDIVVVVPFILTVQVIVVAVSAIVAAVWITISLVCVISLVNVVSLIKGLLSIQWWKGRKSKE